MNELDYLLEQIEQLRDELNIKYLENDKEGALLISQQLDLILNQYQLMLTVM